jgi:alkyl sulfatase BDS1-like metallo-beta-lactamase superfamily hydrolase
MRDLLAISSKIIDDDRVDNPRLVNSTTSELSEVSEGIAIIEAFSHELVFETGDGLVVFDTSLENFGEPNLTSLREWSSSAVNTIVYTHGHVDHVGGTLALLNEAKNNGASRPRIVAHENVRPRFDRYRGTNGYNAWINLRQFSPTLRVGSAIVLADDIELAEGSGDRPTFGPSEWQYPDTTFEDRMSLRAGGLTFDLHHAIGETDDHLWAWIPERKAICSGDFVTWVFPNAGNPQKVQRYPLEWARALRDMVAKGPELLLTAHGLPIEGAARIRGVLDTIAGALESIVEQCLEMMNDGATLDAIRQAATVPIELLKKPYLGPVYDEPEFIVNNVWRLYGGWYDGNPANLKPAPDATVAAEVAALAGGADSLAKRALELSESDDLRLACHLAEMAALADPENRKVHEARAAVYSARRDSELSLMAKGIFGTAATESQEKASG